MNAVFLFALCFSIFVEAIKEKQKNQFCIFKFLYKFCLVKVMGKEMWYFLQKKLNRKFKCDKKFPSQYNLERYKRQVAYLLSTYTSYNQYQIKSQIYRYNHCLTLRYT